MNFISNKSMNLNQFISATICLNPSLDLPASAANNFSVITTVHAEGKPEQWPEETEQANTP